MILNFQQNLLKHVKLKIILYLKIFKYIYIKSFSKFHSGITYDVKITLKGNGISCM